MTFQTDGCVKVQKFEKISDDENNIFCVKPLRTFLGKSEVCDMTLMSGAFEKSVFDGNTILLELSEENDKHRHLYIGGDLICSFLNSDNIFRYVSNMGNNLTPYSIAIGEENTYFLTPLSRFMKNDRSNDNELLKTNKGKVDPFFYHVSNCGKNPFKILRIYKIHSNSVS